MHKIVDCVDFRFRLGENDEVGGAPHQIQVAKDLVGERNLGFLDEREELKKIALEFRLRAQETDNTARPVAVTEEWRGVDEVKDGLRNGGGQEDVLEEAVLLWCQNVMEVMENAACVVVRLGLLRMATETLIHFINDQPSQSWPLVRILLIVFHLVKDAPQLGRCGHDHITRI